MVPHITNPQWYWGRTLFITFLFAILAWFVQHSSLDVALSSRYFDRQQLVFPLEHQPFIYRFGTTFVWGLPFGIGGLWLLAALCYYRRPCYRNVFAALGVVFVGAPLLAGVIKQFTAMPRPLVADVFGGPVPVQGNFWATQFAQGGGALPSVHASSGFVLLSLFFVAQLLGRKGLSWVALLVGVLLGLMFGWLRIMQGYHFLSQVLWALAWVWLFSSVVFAPLLLGWFRNAKAGAIATKA